MWNQDGKQLKETKPIGDLAVSVAYCDESQRAITASWAGAVQVYKADDGPSVGSLITNPPTLDERLAAANATLQQKSAASGPLTKPSRRPKWTLRTRKPL